MVSWHGELINFGEIGNIVVHLAFLFMLLYSNDKTGRQLFFGSIIHLPVLLALLMIHKKWNLPGHKKLEEEEIEEVIEWVDDE
jgi:heme O synthase-like polyprenyltransferase